MSVTFPTTVRMTRRVHVPLHACITYHGDEHGCIGASIQMEDTSTRQYNRTVSLTETGEIEVDHLFVSPKFDLNVGMSRVAGGSSGIVYDLHGGALEVPCCRILDTYSPSAEMILQEVREQLETYRAGGDA